MTDIGTLDTALSPLDRGSGGRQPGAGRKSECLRPSPWASGRRR